MPKSSHLLGEHAVVHEIDLLLDHRDAALQAVRRLLEVVSSHQYELVARHVLGADLHSQWHALALPMRE